MRRSRNRFFVGVSVGLLSVGWFTAGCEFLTGSPGGLFGGNGDQAAASKLRAELSSGTFNAQVDYNEQSDRQTLDIAVTGGTPGAVVEISIGGIAIGSITLDATGAGRLALSSSPAATDELLLPGEFKPPGEGDAVGVGDVSGSFDSVELELKAELSSGDFQAKVKYEVESDEVKFKVEIHGGEPNAVLDVTAAGAAVGSITVNGDGEGEMRWSSRADHENEQPLPTDFPTLAAGDAVAVGSLSGVLSVEEDGNNDEQGDEDGHDDGADDDSNETELKATMESGTLHIDVKYEVESEGAEFEVNVVGGAADEVLNITVVGFAAGSITLDAAGSGHLEYNAHADEPDEQPFPADFPTPVTGDAVSVGSLSGVFQPDAVDDENDDANGDDDGNDNVGNSNGNDNADDNADDNTDDNVGDNVNDNN